MGFSHYASKRLLFLLGRELDGNSFDVEGSPSVNELWHLLSFTSFMSGGWRWIGGIAVDVFADVPETCCIVSDIAPWLPLPEIQTFTFVLALYSVLSSILTYLPTFHSSYRIQNLLVRSVENIFLCLENTSSIYFSFSPLIDIFDPGIALISITGELVKSYANSSTLPLQCWITIFNCTLVWSWHSGS